ncbi:MAG: fasciclin domain-containing protein [Caulobacter sp.]
MRKLNFLSAAAAVALMAGGAHAQAQDPSMPPATPPGTTTPTQDAPAPEPTTPATPTPAPDATTPAAPAPATPAAPMAATPAPSGDIVETLAASGQFTTLTKALEVTNLAQVLKTNQNLTLFAPTDAAFAALPPGELDRLMKNPAELQKVLTFHVVNAEVDSTKLKGAKGPVPTVAGPPIMVDGSGASVMAGNATVTQADLRASNGVIHVVDKVLMPGAAPPATPVAAAPAAATEAGSDVSATVQSPADPAPPTVTTTPSGPITQPQKRSIPDQNDEMRAAEQEAQREAAQEGAATPEAAPTPETTATDTSATVAAPAVTTAPTPAPAGAAVTPQTTTNGPVPDTAENREKYPPQSATGKRTAAKGN